MKRFLCTFLSLLVLTLNILPASAVPNYVYTTTVEENYNASSPVGRFENYSNNGSAVPVSNTSTYAQPVYNYPAVVASTNPTSYAVPVYNTGVYYDTANCNANYNTTASVQDIEVPQTYSKTTTTTTQSIDTREKADKIIDRGLKVVGGLAVLGAVAGLVINAF